MPHYACDVKSPPGFYFGQEGKKPKLWEWWAVGAVKARAAKKAEARKAAQTAEVQRRKRLWEARATAEQHQHDERFRRVVDTALEVFGTDTASPLSTWVPMDWDKDVPIGDDRTADTFWDRHPSELTTLMERLPDAYQANLASLASTKAGSAERMSVAQMKAALDRPQTAPTQPTAFLRAGKAADRHLSAKVGEWLDKEADNALAYVRQLDRHFSRLDAWERTHAQHGATLEAAASMLEPLTKHDRQILPMLAFTEEEIGRKAEELARQQAGLRTTLNNCMFLTGGTTKEIAPLTAEDIERAKRESPKYWRRNLRRRIARAESHVSAILRMAGRHSPFVSTFALAGWRSMQARTRKWMDRKELESSVAGTIERLSLAEVAQHAKEARRSQLVAMVKGMEQYGKDKGYRGVFLTLTLPSEWHSNPSVGENGHDPNLAPWMANKELSERWHRVMSAAHEAVLDFFGVQTKEGHTDGCPHLHAFLWISPEEVDELVRHTRRHFPGEHACKVKLFDDEAGTAKATTYVLTYVLKTLGDGVNAAKTDDGEAEADRRDDGGDRHSTWASRNGIRRFSLVGLPKGLIGKWKAIHRTLRTEDHPADADPTFRTIRRAMAKGQWKRALILLGAFSQRDRLTIRREERTDCWGGTYTAAAAVAVVNPRTGNEIILRPVRWTLVDKKDKKDETESGLSIVASIPRGDSETVADSPSHALAGMEGIGKEGETASGLQLQDFDGWRAMMERRRAERAAA